MLKVLKFNKDVHVYAINLFFRSLAYLSMPSSVGIVTVIVVSIRKLGNSFPVSLTSLIPITLVSL